MVDYAGKQLGNYQLTRLLGEGAFAQVYLGEHIYLHIQAAIKILNTQLADNPVEWFYTEARTIARLIHPNIVRVLEFGVEDETTPFLVLDYAPNGTLRQRHPRGTALPLPTVISYARQIAEALQYAHDEKLIHRDVKPENILLGRNYELLLSDFGVAAMAQTLRSQGVQDVAGTVPYMAPEQIQGQPRRASDQYALGIIVYEWLTGKRPFEGSMSEIVSQQLSTPPPPLRAKMPAITSALEQVVLTALEKDPDKRFGSVRAFALALENAGQAAASTFAGMTDKASLPPAPARNPLTPPIRDASPIPAPVSPLPPISMPVRSPGALIGNYRGHFNPVCSLSWLPDSRRIVSVSNDIQVQIWDALTGNILQRYQDNAAVVSLVAASPDGSRITTVGTDALVRVWDSASNQLLITYDGHVGNTILALAWSPETPLFIATAASDGAVHVWDAATGEALTIYRGHTGSVNALAWSPYKPAIPSGRGYHIVSGGDDASVQTWEATTGRMIARYSGQSAKVLSVAWSPAVYVSGPGSGPDANRSARVACGRADGMIQMWDTTTNREVLSYRHSASPVPLAWSPDGYRFAYASEDRTVQVWDTVTNRKLLTFSHPAPPRVMAWSPDGKYIASGGGDAVIQVWVAP